MSAGKNLRLLLADDDADDRGLFEEAVAEVDPSIKVTTVGDGEALMRALAAAQPVPDLIFLDLNMPKKNGQECLTEIKKSADLKKIPVIIYSTSISQKDTHETWSQEAACFVRKPSSYALLKDILRQIISQDFNTGDFSGSNRTLFNLQ